MSDRLVELAQELYAVPPADFTASRGEIARRVRDEGDKELAGTVGRLRKPSTGAWAVNLLVRRETEQIDQVLAMADSLRAAAESMDGAELRALTRQRRQLTGALATRARQLAQESGARLSAAVAEQVEGTLTAAMLEPAAADAMRTGLLVTTLVVPSEEAYDAAVAVPEALGTRVDPAPAPGLRVVPTDDATRREAARDRLAEAEDEVGEARRGVEEQTATVEELQGRAFQLRSEVDELQRRIGDLEEQADEVDEEVEEAQGGREEAEAALAAAEAARDAAQSALDALGR